MGDGLVRGRTHGSLVRIAENDRVKRAAISTLLLFHLVVIVSGSIPSQFFLAVALNGQGLLTALREKLAVYASAIGLRQDWSMFAPNPLRQNTYIDAEITYRDGRKHIWTFPQMQELGYAERYAKQRYRKFANENLWVKERSALWPDAARYIARLNGDASNPPRIVKLVHYWCVIPSPPPPGEAPQSETWQRDVFFSYDVKPGDLW